MLVHEFNEQLEVTTPKGDGYIWYMMDYGPQSDTLYTIIMKDTGECWQMCHKDFRVKPNTSLGIRGSYTKGQQITKPAVNSDGRLDIKHETV